MGQSFNPLRSREGNNGQSGWCASLGCAPVGSAPVGSAPVGSAPLGIGAGVGEDFDGNAFGAEISLNELVSAAHPFDFQLTVGSSAVLGSGDVEAAAIVVTGISVAADGGVSVTGPFGDLNFIAAEELHNVPCFLGVKKAEVVVAVIASVILPVVGRAGNTVNDLRLPIVNVFGHNLNSQDFVWRVVPRPQSDVNAVEFKSLEQQAALQEPTSPGGLQTEPQLGGVEAGRLQFHLAQFGHGGEGVSGGRCVGRVHGGSIQGREGLRQGGCLYYYCSRYMDLTLNAPSAAYDFILAQSRRRPLLTKVQEIELGRSIRAWQDWPGGPEQAPANVIRRGRRALDKFVECNIRLAAHIAQRFRDRGVPLEDLVQAGVEGLIQAYRRFDPELGYKSSSYACWYVQQACQILIASQGRNIKIPTATSEQMKKVYRTAEFLATQLGREPTDREIDVEAGLKAGTAARLKILNYESANISLDQFEKESKDTFSLVDVIPADGQAGLRQERSELERILHDIINTSPELTPQQRFLIRCRFLNDDPKPRHHLAKELNMNREAVRRAEIAALQTLRRLVPPEMRDCL